MADTPTNTSHFVTERDQAFLNYAQRLRDIGEKILNNAPQEPGQLPAREFAEKRQIYFEISLELETLVRTGATHPLQIKLKEIERSF